MIKITEWTREARTEIEIKTRDNGDKEIFELYFSHHNGQYRAHWGQVVDEYRQGYKSRLSIPYADYNGQTVIKNGRFNRKYLEKADKALEENKAKYFELWQAERHQDLCNELHKDLGLL